MKLPNQSKGTIRQHLTKLSVGKANIKPALRIPIAPRISMGSTFGTNGGTDKCYDELVDCYLDCADKYPTNPLMEDACLASCDAEYRICKFMGGGGLGRIIY
jgi:hypothetical protein